MVNGCLKTSRIRNIFTSDGGVVGAVNRSSYEKDAVVCAAGGLGRFLKVWKTNMIGVVILNMVTHVWA